MLIFGILAIRNRFPVSFCLINFQFLFNTYLNNIFSSAYTSNSLPTSTLFWQCFHCVAFNATLLLKDGEFHFWKGSKRNVYPEMALLITLLFQAWHSLAFSSSSCSCFNKSFARPFLLSTYPEPYQKCHANPYTLREILIVFSRVEQSFDTIQEVSNNIIKLYLQTSWKVPTVTSFSIFTPTAAGRQSLGDSTAERFSVTINEELWSCARMMFITHPFLYFPF